MDYSVPNRVTVPTRIWYVHANGALDSSYSTRSDARARKAMLRTNGTSSVVLSSSRVTVSSAVTDSHS